MECIAADHCFSTFGWQEMAVPGGPVVCLGYLAAASLWKVGCFSAANHGAEVNEIEESVAADGPMVAAVLAALGQPSLSPVWS